MINMFKPTENLIYKNLMTNLIYLLIKEYKNLSLHRKLEEIIKKDIEKSYKNFIYGFFSQKTEKMIKKKRQKRNESIKKRMTIMSKYFFVTLGRRIMGLLLPELALACLQAKSKNEIEFNQQKQVESRENY